MHRSAAVFAAHAAKTRRKTKDSPWSSGGAVQTWDRLVSPGGPHAFEKRDCYLLHE